MATPVIFESFDDKVAAVKGDNKADGGFGVWGTCKTGHGVHGESKSSRGVVGTSEKFHGVYGKSIANVGVAGESDEMHGVLGDCHSPTGAGVVGTNNKGGTGVAGESKTGKGVHGRSETSSGVFGQSKSGRAVEGWSETNYGVTGDSRTFPGVRGGSAEGRGVEGWAIRDDGVWGISKEATGVHGISEASGSGVVGQSKTGRGVDGISESGIGVRGKGGRLAGLFEGDVEVTGDLRLTNADCAEDFDIADASSIEPGTVMVLGDEGALYRSQKAYDKRVAGVVSGAGDYRPGIILDKQQSSNNRQPIALLGKVFCKVDAKYGAISVGDLLTTSPTPGYAMRVEDPLKAFGAVIGKALRPLTDDQGLIPILIALQ
jgi:hypothetical protein